MTSAFRLLLSLVLAFSASFFPLWAGEIPPGWVSLDLPLEREAPVVGLLESSGITTLGWSNALVEVSGFDAVELRPLASLETSLTSWDPRWDPWLSEIKAVFHPTASVSRIWVETDRKQQAIGLLGPGFRSGSAPVPEARRITGFILAAFSFLYLVFRIRAETLPPRLRSGRRWLWLPLSLGLVTGGLLMTFSGVLTTAPARVEASWLHHLWFQQAWPYGAEWKDWSPGKPWAYPTYEHRAGRIVEARTALATPDASWAKAAYEGLDAHQAARLFPPENP